MEAATSAASAAAPLRGLPCSPRGGLGGGPGNKGGGDRRRGPQGVTASASEAPGVEGEGATRHRHHLGPAGRAPRPTAPAAVLPALPLMETRPSVAASTAWAQGTCPREPTLQPQCPHSQRPQACVRGAGGAGGREGHLVPLTLLLAAPTGVPAGREGRGGLSQAKGAHARQRHHAMCERRPEAAEGGPAPPRPGSEGPLGQSPVERTSRPKASEPEKLGQGGERRGETREERGRRGRGRGGERRAAGLLPAPQSGRRPLSHCPLHRGR